MHETPRIHWRSAAPLALAASLLGLAACGEPGSDGAEPPALEAATIENPKLHATKGGSAQAIRPLDWHTLGEEWTVHRFSNFVDVAVHRRLEATYRTVRSSGLPVHAPFGELTVTTSDRERLFTNEGLRRGQISIDGELSNGFRFAVLQDGTVAPVAGGEVPFEGLVAPTGPRPPR